jgi:cellulose synthase/poly-beta-1,6-N-acetylglucosamine synthase-like glycosyltransferase
MKVLNKYQKPVEELVDISFPILWEHGEVISAKNMNRAHFEEKRKMISVVIPTHNEEKAIGTVLDELTEVLEGQTFESIVVDDGSNDDTVNVA